MKKRKIFLCKNLIAGVAGAAFGAVMFLTSGAKSGIYPKILFACMVFLGLYILAEMRVKGQGARLGGVSGKEALLILLLFVNPLLGKVLGFYSSGFLTLLGISAVVRRPHRLSDWGKMVLYLLLVTVGTYLVFSVLLRIHTPEGIFL
ncbi:MAG: tripartite tricarboxylate transporter TctB family protein [Lachnospiraceae bacterium]|nr:tripartite tricarboxylate transporter TctB family protein [Lachnospiraceae bacterium]